MTREGRFRVLLVGRSRCAWADAAVADYAKRLARHGGVTEEVVAVEPFRGDADLVRRAESRRLLERIGPRDALCVLDERGVDLTTEAFAAAVDQGRQRGALVFAIGGAYGHDVLLRERAWRVVRLSSLVLNHEVARVVLYEQLYRAMTVLSGSPYHHA